MRVATLGCGVTAEPAATAALPMITIRISLDWGHSRGPVVTAGMVGCFSAMAAAVATPGQIINSLRLRPRRTALPEGTGETPGCGAMAGPAATVASAVPQQ